MAIDRMSDTNFYATISLQAKLKGRETLVRFPTAGNNSPQVGR